MGLFDSMNGLLFLVLRIGSCSVFASLVGVFMDSVHGFLMFLEWFLELLVLFLGYQFLELVFVQTHGA